MTEAMRNISVEMQKNFAAVLGAKKVTVDKNFQMGSPRLEPKQDWVPTSTQGA